MATTIEVTIKKDGGIEYAVKGVKGKSCKDVSKFLDDALGTVSQDRPTNEMFQELAVVPNELSVR